MSRSFELGAAAVSLAGTVSLLLMTRWGIGTSPDSVHYIRTARQLLGGQDGAALAAGEASLTQHAPLYSLLLAGGGLVGLDPFDGARWVNAVLFGLNIFQVALIVRGSSRNLPWLWTVASLLMLGSVPVLTIHATALSEPVFLFLTLLGFGFLAHYLQNQRQGFLLGAAVAIGLALLARYAGAACILTGAAALLVFNQRSVARRIRDVLLFGVVSSLPMLAWMLSAVTAGGTATGREFVFHPIDRSHVWQALYTASSWLLIPPSAPNAIRFAVWLVLLGVLAVALTRRLRERNGSARPHPAGLDEGVEPLIGILSLFIVVYAVFLAASISFFDANTPLDDRILSPVYAAGLIVVLYAFDGMWPLLRRRRAALGLSLALVIAFVGVHVARGAVLVAASHSSGWGFSSRAWQQSTTLAEVKRLREGTLIYSNAPEIIYLHTGKPSKNIPRTRFLMNQQPNLEFASQLKDVDHALVADCGVIVYFRNLLEQKSVPTEQAIRAQLSLRVRAEGRDGAILSATACPE